MGKFKNKILMTIFTLCISALIVTIPSMTLGETAGIITLVLVIIGNIYIAYRTYFTNKNENLN